MNSPYRVIALHEEVPDMKNVLEYYVMCSNGHVACPVCDVNFNKRNSGLVARWIICYPNNRIVVKGFWWWRKYYPLDGVHKHFTCPSCGAHVIQRLKDDVECQRAVL